MSIYKPTELLKFLSDLGIEPKKGLSQNFLIDGNIIRKIIAEANVQQGDLILEIGPGPGSLTQALLEAGASVITVEKDSVLSEALERLKSPERVLENFCQDIREFPLEETLKARLKPGQKAKVVANLPYHLTTPILTNLLPHHDLFSNIVVMVQDEVARRFTAIPGNREYGSITLFLNYYSKPHYAFTVTRNCFYPSPSVDSAIVNFSLKIPPQVSDEERFFELTRTAFKQRRKMLRSSLRELYTPEAIMNALVAMGKDPQLRPEQLSLEDFIRLFTILNP